MELHKMNIYTFTQPANTVHSQKCLNFVKEDSPFITGRGEHGRTVLDSSHNLPAFFLLLVHH